MEEIVIRSLQGTALPAELERLERWRLADPENDRAYREILRLWDATLRGERRVARAEPPSSFEIIRAARQREAGMHRNEPRESAGSARWGRRIAASIALMAAGFAGSLFQGPKPLMAGNLVTTSAAEMATVTLGDGTVVRLGPSSQVRFPDEPERREVWLEGEAFFSVAALDERPFTVRTGTGTARGMETRFRITTTDSAMRVGVLEGRVAVTVGGAERELVGGEVGQVAAGNLTVRNAASVEELRPDLGNFLAFRSTPLSRVVREVSAHFGIPTEVLDQESGSRTVTASFQDASFVEVMSVVCRITASSCSITDSTAAVVGSAPR